MDFFFHLYLGDVVILEIKRMASFVYGRRYWRRDREIAELGRVFFSIAGIFLRSGWGKI